MKHLIVSSTHYNHLEKGFKEWLDILGYAEKTVSTLPVHIHELFHYLEGRRIPHIKGMQPRHISDFISHLKSRTNTTYGGGLSSSHINKSIHAIKTFVQYLNQTGKYDIDIVLSKVPDEIEEKVILTQAELRQLYDSTFDHYPLGGAAKGQRDRAIIAVFYGCGLRRTEGIRLNTTDIDLVKGLLFVRKGKGNKQRYVPVARKSLEDIRVYLEEGRGWYMEDHYGGNYHYNRHGRPYKKKAKTDDEAFFLTQKGTRMVDFYYRLDQMIERSGINKAFSLHSLRHSIATHLLQSGMPIAEIARFLGHSSLTSTQIYTHIVNHLKQEADEPESL